MNESVGYKAKKELEKIIYEDSGIYRFKQYKKANSLQLLTAYDEIKTLQEDMVKKCNEDKEKIEAIKKEFSEKYKGNILG